MIRSILLVLAEAPHSTSARNYAFWLAQKEGSRIHALTTIDITAFEVPVMGTSDSFMPSIGTSSLNDSKALMKELTANAGERLDQFAAQCTARGIPFTTEVKTGIPEEIVSRVAIAHDIVVVSRTGYNRVTGNQDEVDAMVAPVIRGSVRPVLVAGAEFHEDNDIRTILVAYDGSDHAVRSLLVAYELAARPGVKCTLVSAAQSEDLGNEILAPAEEFLYHHDITPVKQVIISTKPADVICGLVAPGGVDVVIMGAYGHSPIREVLFGSTTERILAHCHTSVILQS